MKKLITAIFAFSLMCSMSAFAKDSTKKAEKAPAAKTMKLKGMVSDAKCGAKVDAACAQKCVKGGSPAVFIMGDKVFKIDNQDAVKDHVGHKVTLDGTLTGDTIHVDKVGM